MQAGGKVAPVAWVYRAATELNGTAGAAAYGPPYNNGTDGVQQVGPQVPLHHVRLGHAVGDRGGGGEGDHPGAVPPPQVIDLHVQVGGAHRPVDRRVGDVGRGPQILVPVRLIYFTARPGR